MTCRSVQARRAAVLTSTPVSISRRNLVASTAAVPLLAALAQPHLAEQSSARLKIVVTGGHPGDPECGCAGTVARYTALGHEVVLFYMNRGEGFCKRPRPESMRRRPHSGSSQGLRNLEGPPRLRRTV